MSHTDELIAKLDGDEWVAARGQLIALGEPAVGPLIAAFTDEANSLRLRMGAAKALSLIGDARAFRPLLDYFNDRRSTRRPSIALYFGRFHNAEVAERLLEAMGENEDVGVRSSAMCSLATIGEPRARDLLLRALERVMSGEEKDAIMRSEVISHIRTLFPKLDDKENFAPVIEPLRKLLNDSDPYVQRNAARALALFDVTDGQT